MPNASEQLESQTTSFFDPWTQAGFGHRIAFLQEAAKHNHIKLLQLLEESQSNLVACAIQGIEAFNGISRQHQARWGLLFDELEIAPESIQRLLFDCLRSTDQRIVFKLAISPSASAARVFRDLFGPSAGNDFEEISLYADTRDSVQFCESLWTHIASSDMHLESVVKPEVVLGHSSFHVPDQRNIYRRKGLWQTAFDELAKKDTSFSDLLRRKGIDPRSLEKASPQLRDSVIRKIAPLVGFRNLLIERGPNSPTSRSELRKGKLSLARIYSGWEAVCLISEANPRWFTGIARQLLIERTRGASGLDLSVEQQFKVIESASQKFQDYISTIPSNGHSESGNLSFVVEKLSLAFRRSVLEAPFVLDPVLCFDVPTDCDTETQNTIIDGMYSGAFVPFGSIDGKSVFSQVLGSRFRLTFLLSPLARLPLRAGKSRSLKTLIELKKINRERTVDFRSGKKSLSSEDIQGRLFDE